MSIRYDPLLARALAVELEARWGGRRVVASVLEPRARVLELRFETGPSLMAFLHPEAGYLLALNDPLPRPGVSYRRLFLGRSRAPDDERLLFFDLVDGVGRVRHQVVLELATNQWNGMVADVEDDASTGASARLRSVLWPREAGERRLQPGSVYQPPGSRRVGVHTPVTASEWRSVLEPLEPSAWRRTALDTFAFVSSLNVDYLLGAAATESEADRIEVVHSGPDAGRPRRAAALEAAFRRYTELCAAKGEAWLLERRWGLQPYVSSLGERGARSVGSLLEAMEEAARSAGGVDRFLESAVRSAPRPAAAGEGHATEPEESDTLRHMLVRRRRRARKRLAALIRELEETGDPEESRSIGNLLLARLGELPRRAGARIELTDFDGSLRAVQLDPSLDVAANARAYFREAARRDRARTKLPQEIAAVERELARADAALERLDEQGPDDSLWEMAGGRPEPSAARGQASAGEPLPYLRLRSSGNLEIRVGRSARANDRLTFAHSAPDDIWLHARQVQGAHVVLRWGRRDENPPKQDLLEAAVVAAVHSAARHSGSVAVDWTRRKYVRKPRKAPPGAVVPERVSTVFVEPDEGLVRRLKARAGL